MAVLIIFPVILQTVINLIMLSKEERNMDRCSHAHPYKIQSMYQIKLHAKLFKHHNVFQKNVLTHKHDMLQA